MAISISNHVGSLQAQSSIVAKPRENPSTPAKQPSSGKPVNRAPANAAAPAFVVSLTAPGTSLNQAVSNAVDAAHFFSTADVALTSTTNIHSRIRELTLQMGSGKLDATARGAVQKEISALKAVLDRLASSAKIDGTGSAPTTETVQAGNQKVATSEELTLATAASADGAPDTIGRAQSAIPASAGTAGATEAPRTALAAWLAREASVNRLAAGPGRLTGTDLAVESSQRSHDGILDNAAASVLAQANQHPQAALRLLGG